MHAAQAPYRELLDRIRSVEAPRLLDEVIRPWLAENAAEREFFVELTGRAGDPIPDVSREESWRLYALSRNHDVLVTQLSTVTSVDGRAAVAAARVELMTALGLTAVVRRPFHPFFHEIVTVERAAVADAPIELVEEIWTGFTLGPMMFARAGARVRAGADQLDPRVAERSVLYWAYERDRPTLDLSVGWGSNSQWRTSFRRDYHIDGQFFYNVDGVRPRIDANRDGLSDIECLELVRHRSFVLSERDSEDLFPYHECVHERDGVASLGW